MITRPKLPDLCLNGIWDFKSDTDDEWTRIRVPGAYTGVRKGWGGSQWDCFDYPRAWEDTGGMYRRTFTVPEYMRGHDIQFVCNACAHHSEIYVNNIRVGEWHDGYTPMHFSITAALTRGENLLEVRVSGQKNDLFDDYGTYRRGMWQDCFLRACPEVCVQDNLFIIPSHSRSELRCEIPVRNQSGRQQAFSIYCRITETDGTETGHFRIEDLSLDGGRQDVFAAVHDWPDAHCWFPHDPYLYDLIIEICTPDGCVIDRCRERFGFREITWKGPHLFINGRELFLRGHGGHYLGDIQGTRSYMEAWLGKMKEMGINFMRLHDSPKHAELYDVADELGMMLESEAVCHFKVPEDESVWKEHLKRLVMHHRNHPSVILWSVSNELRWRGGGEKPEMIEWVRNFDTTRPVFASDFSLKSRHGDVVGHHYDPESVFDDWKKFGPDKPMIWDELGWVWPHDRPLDNGTSGYEVQAQDYATGLWHDGFKQIYKDLSHAHDGRSWNGELHRVNGYCIWDFIYVFFRWQPTQNNQVLRLEQEDVSGPGIRHRHIRSVASPVNIWDPSLPVLEPNPGYYLFEKFLKPVRFFDSNTSRSFFSQSQYAVTSRLFYDDTRPADRITCRVETLDGSTCTEQHMDVSLRPGQIMDCLETVFDLPETDRPSQVRLVREFSDQRSPGYRDERDGTLFPQRIQSAIPVFVRDGDASLSSALIRMGGTVVSSAQESDVAVCKGEQHLEDREIQQYIRQGGRVIILCAEDEAENGIADSPMIPLNGPDHRLLDKLGQEHFTFLQTGSAAPMLYPPETKNTRTVISGNRDGQGAVLYELFSGNGLAVVTSLDVLNVEEPALRWLFNNMLQYAAEYKPVCSKRTMLLGGECMSRYFSDLGLEYQEADLSQLKSCGTLLLDAGSTTAMTQALKNQSEIRDFVNSGGTVLACGTDNEKIQSLRDICRLDLRLTDPFLGERTHCIKAPVSWTRSDTPVRMAEYYQGVLVPQPFEPNYDPLLSGLVNRDLDWGGAEMFTRGIELSGMDPVRGTAPYSILISNWHIDWSKPAWGGEYIHAGKDERRADWFVNRDPVLLGVRSGRGRYLFCQLNFSAGGEKGQRAARQLMTNLKCSLNEPAAFAPDEQTFDLTAYRRQIKRLQEHARSLPAAKRKYYGTPEHLQTAQPNTVIQKPRVMLIGDDLMLRLFPYIQEELWETHQAEKRFCMESPTTHELLDRMQQAGDLSGIPLFQLGVGIEDLRLDNNGTCCVSVDDFSRNLENLVCILAKTDAKLYWNTIIPLPAGVPDFKPGTEDEYNRAAQQIMDRCGVYTFDLNRMVRETFPGFLVQDSLTFSDEQIAEMARQTASAIAFFGAQ